MARKKKGIKPGDLIIFGIVMLFGFLPLGLLMIILGIIWAISESKKKTANHRISTTSHSSSIDKLFKNPNTYNKQTQEYQPPIQEKVEDMSYTHKEYTSYTDRQQTPQEEYTYTSSHTEAEARDRRKTAFSGILYLQTDNIGNAIGLMRLARKLAGIKKIVIEVSVDKGAEIMGVKEKDGHIRIKTTSVKDAIDFLRKAYAQWGLKGITLHIYLKKIDTPEVETLLEIAQSTYGASKGEGGGKHVLTV
ncbi:hypothetical protein GM182_00080 [bacterium 3DAC]|nr:hypothetical protein [Dictyoglomota bacterium]UZN22350.1 hypothetical protein GM182_00080 [bacterium 3DAC]